MKAHFNIKAGMMKNLTLHVPLNTPKPRVECINLLHAGARVTVLCCKPTQALPHRKVLTEWNAFFL